MVGVSTIASTLTPSPSLQPADISEQLVNYATIMSVTECIDPCCSTSSSSAKRVQDSNINRPRAIKRKHCEHCDQDLSVKTFKKHRSLYMRADGTWIREENTALLASCNQGKLIDLELDLP